MIDAKEINKNLLYGYYVTTKHVIMLYNQRKNISSMMLMYVWGLYIACIVLIAKQFATSYYIPAIIFDLVICGICLYTITVFKDYRKTIKEILSTSEETKDNLEDMIKGISDLSESQELTEKIININDLR